MLFSACRGGDNCTKDGTHCQGCGRSHEEIARTKQIVGSIVQFAQEMDYENYRNFCAFLGDKAARKIEEARTAPQGV